MLKEWQKTVILGEGLAAALPKSALIRFWPACGLALRPEGLEQLREDSKKVVRLNLVRAKFRNNSIRRLEKFTKKI